jgi:hypothetical protein
MRRRLPDWRDGAAASIRAYVVRTDVARLGD